MFKKAIAIALIVATASHSFAETITAKESDSIWTRVQKAGFEALYFGNIPLLITPISYVMELKERHEAKQLIKSVQSDAMFFDEHVTHSERGYMASQVYSKMQIVLKEGEVLTADFRVDPMTSETREAVVAYTPGVYNAEEINATRIKINNRLLIPENLYKAHLAAQFLIYSDSIIVPQDLRDENGKDAKAATSGSTLNKIIIRYNNGNL